MPETPPGKPQPDESDLGDTDPSDRASGIRPAHHVEPSATYPPESGVEEDEYELEPVDQRVLDHHRSMADQEVHDAESSVDLDEIFADESRREHDYEYEPFQMRFGVKHIMAATAGVAILITLIRIVPKVLGSASVMTMLFALTMLGLATAHFYMDRLEKQKKEQQEQERRRRVARLRAKGHAFGEDQADMYDSEEEEPEPDEPIRLRFGIRDLLLAITMVAGAAAAILFFGLPVTSMLVGMVAMAGVISYALDFEVPQPFVITWWIALVIYVLLTIGAALFG
ncbi:hypothetical protein Mal64_38100 [Pseudobythopirellula maris]|uniref:Uncharacterized protein n=1 Tax=Pseudobythopirellula maris TaxID=2527991 RepID=A0A5C5ZGL5_9BACT|nr:hypothetical protein [Pseudobythopirellula maris]TWT86270.1 hypothetical protein Mal64_38100 [Pseudobythopirellula maris]